ncbi:hypothetical protein [Falsiroseomonas sp. E2-1-a4]|uniref:hypothetical protein n=1 Tax=Falsiroseomonas sp. E2-1-a4 TaxID=3239299 RepID=UPI003F2CDF50
MRHTLLYGLGTLVLVAVVAIVIVIQRQAPAPGTAAAFRQLSAASGRVIPHAVPIEARRAAADTCEGYNLELEEGAGIQTRIGNTAEAQRLLSMRQTCGGATTVIRSAR